MSTEQIKAERRQDPDDLARHSTAAHQAHCDATPADHVTVVQFDPAVTDLDVVLDNQLSAGRCRFPILLLPVASATRRPTISDRGRFEITGTSDYTLSVALLQRSAGRNS